MVRARKPATSMVWQTPVLNGEEPKKPKTGRQRHSRLLCICSAFRLQPAGRGTHVNRPLLATLAWEPRPSRVRKPRPGARQRWAGSRAGAARRATPREGQEHRSGARRGLQSAADGPAERTAGGQQAPGISGLPPAGSSRCSTRTLQLTGCSFNAQRQSDNSPQRAGGPGAGWPMGHLPPGPAERSEVQSARWCERPRTWQRRPKTKTGAK